MRALTLGIPTEDATASLPPPTTKLHDRSGYGYGALLVAVFLVVAFAQAHWRLLWADEFLTYWVARQGPLDGIWAALRSGADPNPPLLAVLVWGSTRVFGSTPVAMRLASIAGSGLAMVCVWGLIRRRAAAVYAAAGCLALMLTEGFDYTYDARAYGLLMGLTMAAVLAWDGAQATEGGRRRWWLGAMGVTLAAVISTNYYGVLAFVMVAVGEGVGTAVRRRFRWGVWVTLAVAALPMVAYLPLVRADHAEFVPHAWARPDWGQIPDSYLTLVGYVLWPVLGLAAVWGWRRFRGVRSVGVPVALGTVVLLLLALPFLGLGTAFAGAGLFHPRYTVPVCCGVALAGGLLLAQVAGRRMAQAAVGAMLVCVVVREGLLLRSYREQRHAFRRYCNAVERAAAPGEPVMVSDFLLVFPLYWYGSDALREEIVFPVDFEAIHRVAKEDSGQQNVWGGRNGVFPFRIGQARALLPKEREGLFLGDREDWLGKMLVESGYLLREPERRLKSRELGAELTPLARGETGMLYVLPPKGATQP